MVTLQNEKLSMKIALLGAEPQSLFSQENGIEYLWSGDKDFWPRRAPLLFPMTGPTMGGKIEASGTTYMMPNNGFARDLIFALLSQSSDKATFELQESEATLQYYPYGFRLRVIYTLLDDGFKAEAEVYAKDDLFFTFGWHPAFSLDINGIGSKLESYSVSFEKEESVDRKRPVGGIFATDKKFLDKSKTLRLSREETDKGPIILNGLKSKHVTLTSGNGEHGVLVERGNLETLVLWTVETKHAQFLCIEPMHSFGDIRREFSLEKMDEVLPLKEGESKAFSSSFHIF
jgi:galactose mutarotase-like enzyme